MIKKYASHELYVIVALIVVAVAPLLLQKSDLNTASDADKRLVIMTPHNETIKREFSEAFTEYWQEKTGEKVYIDWRSPGGIREIRMVLESDFSIAEKNGSDSIGVDVFFGGGTYEFQKMAKNDRLAPLRVFEQHKEWFKESGAKNGIRESFTGERCYGEKKRWIGVCLSQFGICYNVDGISALGLDPPQSWDDLGNPEYFGHLALVDPTKSDSVARAFEMLIQQKIHVELAIERARPGETRQQLRNRAIRNGWAKGLQLIQRISANARYFTDSATKIPHDVSQGDAVAGMCGDFYGRTYNESLKKPDGTSRLQWVPAKGGTSTGVDPVGVFRGAPSPELAHGFVEFLLTKKGQMLWNARRGTKNGPKHRVLRRLPIRPDLYQPEQVADYSDPKELPYLNNADFTYDPSITGVLFEAMREQIKVMCIDTHDELTDAWGAIIAKSNNGVLPKRPLERFNDVKLFSYTNTFQLKRVLDKRRIPGNGQVQRNLWADEKLNRLAAIIRRYYSDAKKLANKETPPMDAK